MPQPDQPPSRIARSLELGKRPEWAPLLVLIVAAALAWGFVELADEVVEGSTASLDRRLLFALRSGDDPADPIGPPWLEELGRDATALGGAGVLALLTATVAGTLLMLHMPRAAAYVLAAICGALVLSIVMKAAIDRPRPDLVPHGSIVSMASFPSGHSALAAATYLTLGILVARQVALRRLKFLAIGLAVLVTLAVGVSRVYLGVHWPTDVLAGWTIGASWALLCWSVAMWLEARGQIEHEVEIHPREKGGGVG